MHLADVAGLDEEADHRPRLGADEVLVHRGAQQQRRDGRVLRVAVAVRQDDEPLALPDHRVDLVEDLLQAALKALAASADRVEARDADTREAGLVAVIVDVQDLGELVVVDDRERKHDLTAVRRGRLEHIALGPDDARQRGDDLLADGVERRVRHLGEQLREVVEQHAGPLRQHGDRSVCAHRAEGLPARARHRLEDDAQLLLGVPEGLLTAGHGRRGVDDVLALGKGSQVDETRVEPLTVRTLGSELGLDLVVLDDPASGRVDEEHQPRLEATLAGDRRRVDVEHAGLRAEHDEAVLGDPEPSGAQSIAVEDRADLRAVGEADIRRAVPRLHERRVVLVERPPCRVHRGVVLPRLGDHHQHRVGQRAATEMQQLQDLVERGAIAATR